MYLTKKKNKYILYDLNEKILIITSHKGAMKQIMDEQRDVENKQSVFEPSNIDTSEVLIFSLSW